MPSNLAHIPSFSIILNLINFLPVHRFGSQCFKSHILTLKGTTVSTVSSLDSKMIFQNIHICNFFSNNFINLF